VTFGRRDVWLLMDQIGLMPSLASLGVRGVSRRLLAVRGVGREGGGSVVDRAMRLCDVCVCI
jgi:hypothetical protein